MSLQKWYFLDKVLEIRVVRQVEIEIASCNTVKKARIGARNT